MRCSVILIQILVSFVGLLVRVKAQALLLEPDCGLADVTERIVGGTNATHGANPWMAYLYRRTQFLCGGSLIHKRFALTAAHCILDNVYLSVRLGEYSSTSRASSSAVYNVTLALRNGYYSKENHINDIGLLRLDPEVQFNAYIRPVCIYTDVSQVPYVSSFRATGWGITSNDKFASALQTIQLQDMDSNGCYKHMNVTIGPGQICAGHPDGDTCLGDSGGPLVQLVEFGDKWRYVQFGLVSYGTNECVSPAIYTRVPYYADWIARAVRYGLTQHQN